MISFHSAGCCLAARDVTGSQAPPSESTLVTEEVGTETVTTSSTSNQTVAEESDVSTDDPTQFADPSQSPTTTGQDDGRTDSTHPSSLLQEDTTIANQPVSQSQVVVNDPPVTTTILPETTTTTNSTTIRLTTQPILTSSVTGTIQVDHSTAGNLNDSTTIRTTESSTVSTTTTENVTTKRPTRTPRTTTQRRTTTTTSPYHECVTSSTCVDPNAHCVNLSGTNTCECRTGFRKNSPNGSCVQIELPTTTTSTTTATTTMSSTTSSTTPLANVTVTSSTVVQSSSSTEPPMTHVKVLIFMSLCGMSTSRFSK